MTCPVRGEMNMTMFVVNESKKRVKMTSRLMIHSRRQLLSSLVLTSLLLEDVVEESHCFHSGCCYKKLLLLIEQICWLSRMLLRLEVCSVCQMTFRSMMSKISFDGKTSHCEECHNWRGRDYCMRKRWEMQGASSTVKPSTQNWVHLHQGKYCRKRILLFLLSLKKKTTLSWYNMLIE